MVTISNYDSATSRMMLSQAKSAEDMRSTLEDLHGKYNVFNTAEATEKFSFLSFAAPLVAVERKIDGVKGVLEFTHSPRFYFNFRSN
jgi:hypothetical protein